MNSRERVLRAINRQDTDRVPFGLFATSAANEDRIRMHINALSKEDMYRKIGLMLQRYLLVVWLNPK